MVTPRRAGTVVALLAALAVLAPFFVLFAYAHPQNDDWVSAVSAAREGVLGATERWLRAWGGRYSATLLNLLTPLAGGTIEGWRGALAAYGLAVPVGIWTVAGALAPRAWRGLEPLVVAAVLSALLFGGMPFAAGGLYWMNGAICYGVGEGLALLAVALLLAGERPGARAPWAWAGTGALLAVTAAGMNEITALLLIGTLAVLVAVQAVRGRVSPRVALVLAAGVAGLVAVLLLPGTRIRLESGGPTGGRHLAPLAAEAVAIAAGHAVSWCWRTPILPVALLFALAAARARQRGSAWTLPHPGIVGPVAAVALVGAAFLPLYGQGTIPPHTLNLVHAVFVVGVVLVAASAGNWLGARRPGDAVRPWVPVAAWAAAVALALLPGSAGRTAWSDLLAGRAARYDAALVERYALLKACGPICVVPRLEDPPPTLSWFEDAIDEATETPFFRGYKDASYGRYFGKRRIRLAPP